jgi:glutathione S-transferase
MYRLIHILMSPACRFVRLVLGEKRVVHHLEIAPDATAQLPVLVGPDGSSYTGVWAIVDHVEGLESDVTLVPEDEHERAETFRLLDWTATKFNEEVTKRIVWEKASRSQTGNLQHRPPNMETIRLGRGALAVALDRLGPLAEEHGYLACRELTLGDLALAAHLSALDYYGEVPWTEHPAIAEWYMRMKSRPSFRPLLSDRVPGQPPVPHYAELDF